MNDLLKKRRFESDHHGGDHQRVHDVRITAETLHSPSIAHDSTQNDGDWV